MVLRTILFYCILIIGCTKTDEKEAVFTGDTVLITQEEVDVFGARGYTTIVGDLIIGPSENITNKGLDGNYAVNLNMFNPTSQDIIDGSCEL